MSKENCKICIIGAGLAGLFAADELLNKDGFENVTILEGSDRIGGRVRPFVSGGQGMYLPQSLTVITKYRNE